MKALSFLVPVLNLIRHFGFIYRLIGIVGCFVFFNSNFKDVMFLSSSKGAEPMTIEQLMELPKDDIPRYLKLENLTLLSDTYVATQNEETGKILDASYPVYSIDQLAGGDSLALANVEAHVIVKDKDFSEESLSMFMNVDGMYDDESFAEEKNILTTNGIKVSDKAILVVKERPPSMKSSLIGTLITGILGILILLSFVPNKVFGVEPPAPESQPTESE